MCAAMLGEPVAVLTVKRHLIGFSLELTKGDRGVLAALYGLQSAAELKRLKPAERILGRDQTLGELLDDLVDQARGFGYKVSICGDRKNRPVLRIWQQQEQAKEIQAAVVFDNALWSDDPAVWEAAAPGLFKQIDAAFRGTGPRVSITCSTAADHASGTVIVEKGQARVNLVVFPQLYSEEFEPSAEADDIGSWFSGCVGSGQAGAQVIGTVTARRLETLMRRLRGLAVRLQAEADACCYVACPLPTAV